MLALLSRWVYRAVRGAVRLCYRRPEIEGLEYLPEGPCVIVGNHAQMHGPIIAEIYLPGERAIWCNAEMMHLREVPDYAYRDFWPYKPKSVRWLYRILSYLIAPLSVCVFNNARCVGVYRDRRLLETFRETLRRLESGARVIIFPERDAPHNAILCDFQDGFVDLGRSFARRTGQALRFVPMYVAPALKKVVLGPPVAYDPAVDPASERRRVCGALMEAITRLARALPRHRVVPYLNIAKKDYPENLPDEEPTE